MPECLDNMPWRSLKGLGDMAPDFLKLGDFKNVRLTDGTMVQFRIIGFRHDVTKSGRILPLSWEMVDCLPKRHRWNSDDTNRGSWGATELFHKMNDEYGEIYQLMPAEILEVVEPVIKLTANTYDGANELLETECKFWIKSEKETFGRNIYSAPGEGHWYEYYRQEDVPWGKLSTLCCVLLITTPAATSALCTRAAARTIPAPGIPPASPRLSASNLCIKSIGTTEVVQDKTTTTEVIASVVFMSTMAPTSSWCGRIVARRTNRGTFEIKEYIHMAKIVIAGDAVVVTSAMKLEDIKTIEKYRPKELVLKGGEDGKEPIFGVGTTHGAGNINAVGASFGSETRDDDKLACITLFLDGVTGDVKDWVADRLGAAIINLNKLEEKLPAVLEEIAAEKATVMSNITVAQ